MVAAGADVIHGGKGSDTLVGGGGNNTFVIKSNTGDVNVISDYSAATATIDISSFGTSFGSLTITDSAGNAVIDLGGGQTLTLNGVTSSSLTASNFIFLASTPPPTLPPGADLPLSLTLTAGSDILNGKGADDTFNAIAANFNAGDTLDGAGGTGDTLAITGGGTFNLNSPATVANIENVTVGDATATTITLYNDAQESITGGGGNDVFNLVANTKTSTADFSSANIATGDDFLLVLDDGADSFVFHYQADGTAATTAAADLSLLGILVGMTDANTIVVGDFI